METDSPTFELMNELIGPYGLSEEFIWTVIGPSPHVMFIAFTGHVEYLGPTLERLQRVRHACQILSEDRFIKVPIQDFIEAQVLVMDTEQGLEYKRAGEFIADGVLTDYDTLIYARETTSADIISSQELLSLLGKHPSPSKYHPILRAIRAESPET